MPTYPAYFFVRDHDAEREVGFELAGLLFVNIPKSKKLKKRQRLEMNYIVKQLYEDIKADPLTVIKCALWHGGQRPADAVDVNDDALMQAWADDLVCVAVEVDPGRGGDMRIDSNLARQLGLTTTH